MPNRFLVFVIFVFPIGMPPALPCSFVRPGMWAKNPKSSSALFRVVIDGKAGYVDRLGPIVIKPRFNPRYFEQGFGDFVEGLALVFVSDGHGFLFGR